MLIHLLPMLVPLPLLIGAAAGFINEGVRPKHLADVAEAAALAALAAAIVSAAALSAF